MRRILVLVPVVLLMGACTFGAMPSPEPDEPGRISGSKLLSGPGEPEMDPEARVNNLLQNAKAAYDDRHFEAAHRYAEQAERIDTEKLGGRRYVPMALNIQAYSLMQLGLIDDYRPAGQPTGKVRGALTKFDQVLKLQPRDFRAQLGYGLAKFRRHGIHIGKAEKLGEGLLVLAHIGYLTDTALDPSAELPRAKVIELLNEAAENIKAFAVGRARLLELREVFSDPMAEGVDPVSRRLIEAPWIGPLGADKEELAVHDMTWFIDDARKTGKIAREDLAGLHRQLAAVTANWRVVRDHWRKAALADLQASRDALLGLRDADAKANPENARYFWVDRDLAFVFTSLGGFFLDFCLEDLNRRGIKEGKKIRELREYAVAAFIADDYKTEAKEEARKNYRAAQTFYESFIRRHEEFEKLRVGKAQSANFDDVTANPFLVDLVSRYKSEMFDAVQEDRKLRKAMLLELCALVVDPIYQVNDLEKAKIYANQLKAMDPRNPVHHFVRATASFEQGEYADALPEYEAYMKVSSIVEDANTRKHVRQRMETCRRVLTPRGSGASGN